MFGLIGLFGIKRWLFPVGIPRIVISKMALHKNIFEIDNQGDGYAKNFQFFPLRTYDFSIVQIKSEIHFYGPDVVRPRIPVQVKMKMESNGVDNGFQLETVYLVFAEAKVFWIFYENSDGVIFGSQFSCGIFFNKETHDYDCSYRTLIDGKRFFPWELVDLKREMMRDEQKVMEEVNNVNK